MSEKTRFLAEIGAMDALLKARKIGPGRLCAAAGIDASCWSRWRAGQHFPSVVDWRRVVAEFHRLTAEAAA